MADRVCPVWIGYILASPLRKLFENPNNILQPHVKPGMTAVDVGPAMGFFTLPLARLVGPQGRVLAVDSQESMIKRLNKRARRAGLRDVIEPRLCGSDSLELGDVTEQADFVLAFAVVHEVPDQASLFREIHTALKPGGRLLLAEPVGHVSAADFEATVSAAEAAGFHRLDSPRIRRSRAVVMAKQAGTV